jgi:hypothetical protein
MDATAELRWDDAGELVVGEFKVNLEASHGGDVHSDVM